MNENDEKGKNREEDNVQENNELNMDKTEQEDRKEDNDLIEDLLSNLDLPGDKDIDRSISSGVDFIEEEEEEWVENEDTRSGDPATKSKHYKANPTVDYDRPKLKTDKTKRVTKDAIDSLFKDLDLVMSGEKPSENKPLLSKEPEPERKVSDLAKEELDYIDTDNEIVDEEPFSYDEDEDGKKGKDDKETFEDIAADKDDLLDVEWPHEKEEIDLDEIDIKDENEAELDELSSSKDGEELENIDIEKEPKQPVIEEDIKPKEEKLIEDLGDIDNEIIDEELSPPSDSIDKIPDKEKESKIEDSKEPIEIDDFESYIENKEVKMEDDAKELLEDLPIEKDESDETTDETSKEEASEGIEEMFTDTTPEEDEHQDIDDKGIDDKEESMVDKEEDDSLEIEGLEEIEIDDIEEEEIAEDKKIQEAETTLIDEKDIPDEDTSKPADTSTILDAQSLIDSIDEPELTQDTETSTKEPEIEQEVNVEQEIEEIKEEYPEDLTIMETPPEEKEKEPLGDSEGLEIEENLEILDEDSDKEEEKETRPPAKREIEFTDHEIRVIQANLLKLPQPLKDIITDIIVKEKLPPKDIKNITEALIGGADTKTIKKIVENKLNINIKIKKSDTTKLLEKEKKSNIISKFVASFIFIAFLFIPIWFLVIKPYMDTEAKYKEGILDIQKGENHYSNAIKKFIEAKGGSQGDRKWYILYAKEFLKQGNPKAYYYAHNFLAGDDPKNKLFLQKYHTGKKQNKQDKRENPGSEEKIKENSPIVENPIENGIIKYLPEDKEALIILAENYIKKAIWIANNKDTINNTINWDDVDYYINEAVNNVYQPLAERYQNDQEILDKEARTYILWAELLQHTKPELIKQKLKNAENNYNKILTLYQNSPVGLYGLLSLHITKEQLEGTNTRLIDKINAIQKAIEKLEVDYIDEEILSKYAFYLIEKEKKIKKAKKILNNIIRKGKIYPKAYYYLGLVYNKERDAQKSLESYVKGIFAFYYLKIGEEKFFARIRKVSNKFERKSIMNTEMLNAINTVIRDTDPVNSRIQSMLFNKIGENILVLAGEFRENIEEERNEQKHILRMAQKSFLLSIQKELYNYKAWKNIGDLAYFDAIKQTAFFLEGISKKQISKFDILYKLKELNQFKKAKYYYNNTLKLMIRSKYKNIENENQYYLWQNLLGAVKNNKIDPDLFYKLGFIFYHEHDYKQASQIWHSIKTIMPLKFNPSLNFALGNAYIRNNDHGQARRHYQNAIDFYKTIAEKYTNAPNPFSKRQNAVFAKLAKNHNNMGVSYHIMGEELNNYKLKEYARLHYFKAREYASRLNNNAIIAKELWNQNILNKNYIALANYNVSLQQRLEKKQIRLKTKDIQSINSINPLDHMLIDNLEYVIK